MKWIKLCLISLISIFTSSVVLAESVKCSHGVKLQFSSNSQGHPQQILLNGKVYSLTTTADHGRLAYQDANQNLYWPWVSFVGKGNVLILYSFRMDGSQVLPGIEKNLVCKTGFGLVQKF